jgi:hypothetical protein
LLLTGGGGAGQRGVILTGDTGTCTGRFLHCQFSNRIS